MKGLLDPLQLHLKEFKLKVEETYDKESKERFSLEKELRVLIELNKQLGEEANNLTHALKYNNKVQGNWGEMILESLLEHSGLTRDREYFIQEYLRDQSGTIIKDEDGRAMQPDVTIVYPDQRKVIVDSKMSLVAYEQYVNAAGMEESERALKEHIKSVRQHIEGLSRKNYPRYAGNALDYVILFIPVEPAFLLAVKEDQQLWKYAYDKRILLVSPTNILAVLKIIVDLWKVEKQSQHAIEIAEKAGALYDKFVLFMESMELVGTHLQKATDAHGTAIKRLAVGNGNLVKQAERLKEMGAKTSRQLPDHLLKRTEDE
jgi:DNA recombination protein RmuC